MFRLYLVASLFLIISTDAVDKVILPDADRTYLIEMLGKTHDDISADNAAEIVNELENFYTGVRDKLWESCGPPYIIDKAFHLHIINTGMYAAFSELIFGRFVHHSPFWSAHPPPIDLNKRCGNLINKLKDHGVQIINENLWGTETCGEEKEQPTTADDDTESEWNRKYKKRKWVCEL